MISRTPMKDAWLVKCIRILLYRQKITVLSTISESHMGLINAQGVRKFLSMDGQAIKFILMDEL
jgi:hypothetical protein